jgi:hypothetical protein
MQVFEFGSKRPADQFIRIEIAPIDDFRAIPSLAMRLSTRVRMPGGRKLSD